MLTFSPHLGESRGRRTVGYTGLATVIVTVPLLGPILGLEKESESSLGPYCIYEISNSFIIFWGERNSFQYANQSEAPRNLVFDTSQGRSKNVDLRR